VLVERKWWLKTKEKKWHTAFSDNQGALPKCSPSQTQSFDTLDTGITFVIY
jgi:hypothetical protein